jgi:hypothetical protein
MPGYTFVKTFKQATHAITCPVAQTARVVEVRPYTSGDFGHGECTMDLVVLDSDGQTWEQLFPHETTPVEREAGMPDEYIPHGRFSCPIGPLWPARVES